MILIGLSGPAGCGKDTAAAAMLACDNSLFWTAFANSLKAGICTMFGLPTNIFSNRETKEKIIPEIGKSPRQLAQIIGTECVRKMISEDAWLFVMKQFIEAAAKAGIDKLIITDVRFENEARFIREQGGTIIHIVRRDVTWNHEGHESERGIEIMPDDHMLTNNSTLDEFKWAAVTIYHNITKSIVK